MTDPMTPAWIMPIIGIFLIILVVLWILLPFALFGTKGILREILAEMKRNNALLEALGKSVEANRLR